MFFGRAGNPAYGLHAYPKCDKAKDKQNNPKEQIVLCQSDRQPIP